MYAVEECMYNLEDFSLIKIKRTWKNARKEKKRKKERKKVFAIVTTNNTQEIIFKKLINIFLFSMSIFYYVISNVLNVLYQKKVK